MQTLVTSKASWLSLNEFKLNEFMKLRELFLM